MFTSALFSIIIIEEFSVVNKNNLSAKFYYCIHEGNYVSSFQMPLSTYIEHIVKQNVL